MGAVAWGQWPTPRFPSPLIEPDVRSYRIRLSDWLHRKAHSGADRGRRSRHSTPRFRWISSYVNRRLPRPATIMAIGRPGSSQLRSCANYDAAQRSYACSTYDHSASPTCTEHAAGGRTCLENGTRWNRHLDKCACGKYLGLARRQVRLRRHHDRAGIGIRYTQYRRPQPDGSDGPAPRTVAQAFADGDKLFAVAD